MPPAPPVRAPSRAPTSKDLPPSVEAAYYRKCIDLRRRITDIEDNNDGTRLRITRLNRGIQKMRLERAFLLEQLNKHMEYNVDDSDRSSSPPPTPTDKPLRSKRSHNRKGTPPAGAGGVESETGRMEGGMSMGRMGGMMNPMSSAQSTPDPGSRPQNSYFGTIGGPTATSPHTGVNGATAPTPQTLPPLHALPSLQQQQQQPQQAGQRPYFDPAYDEQRTAPAGAEDDAGRRRAYSGSAQQPPPPPTSAAATAPAAPATVPSAPAPASAPPQNGDTEMTDAGFTAVNRNS